ncbi:sulfurtransferase [Kineosporia sp. J2-2]|uniref:Sulfurtransferase n=1 Tax=Kineosporia corallincola TaxID=2835133 RepID=A0ABS5TSL3_9ACTN|nr:rhodanese-like domain-containing protein [Kineosporia corallincola]MBT0773777.1 sulfurtransferase [Kineosporia corallincola]
MSSLVTPAWLASRAPELRNGSLVLLDASIHRSDAGYSSGRDDYEASHLPGAQFADLFLQFSDPAGGFAFAAPGADQVQAAARAVGISDDTTVVVYDRLSGAWAARLWWLLRAHGIDRVFVLDGGLNAWGAGLVSGPDQGPVRPGTVTVRPRAGFFAGLAEVRALSGEPSAASPVVCALRQSEYARGHIPNSSSLPYPELLSDDGTVDLDRARQAAAGYADAERVVLYCGGAINAAGLALALTEGGLPAGRITIYDGSLSEWRADPSLPLATAASS